VAERLYWKSLRENLGRTDGELSLSAAAAADATASPLPLEAVWAVITG
jgi:hypothetical protein